MVRRAFVKVPWCIRVVVVFDVYEKEILVEIDCGGYSECEHGIQFLVCAVFLIRDEICVRIWYMLRKV